MHVPQPRVPCRPPAPATVRRRSPCARGHGAPQPSQCPTARRWRHWRRTPPPRPSGPAQWGCGPGVASLWIFASPQCYRGTPEHTWGRLSSLAASWSTCRSWGVSRSSMGLRSLFIEPLISARACSVAVRPAISGVLSRSSPHSLRYRRTVTLAIRDTPQLPSDASPANSTGSQRRPGSAQEPSNLPCSDAQLKGRGTDPQVRVWDLPVHGRSPASACRPAHPPLDRAQAEQTRLPAPEPLGVPPTPSRRPPHLARTPLPRWPCPRHACRRSGMGKELGPHPEVARLRTTPGPPALRKLSAVSGASPGTSPRSATARQAGSMSRSRSSGSGLGPSVDTLQPAAADAGAGSGSSDTAAAAAAQSGPSGTAPAAAPGSTSPDLPSTLAALHALNPPTANGTAVTAAAGAQQGGKQHSKHSSFFGMFQRTPKSGKPAGPSDAASEEHGSSSAGEGKTKKSSSWFGFGGGKKRPGSVSASPLPSPNGVPPLAAAGRTASGCLLLPGLPIVEGPGRSGSRPGSRAGSSTGGSDAAAPASGGGTPGAVAGLRAGYAGDVSASDASGKQKCLLVCWSRAAGCCACKRMLRWHATLRD